MRLLAQIRQLRNKAGKYWFLRLKEALCAEDSAPSQIPQTMVGGSWLRLERLVGDSEFTNNRSASIVPQESFCFPSLCMFAGVHYAFTCVYMWKPENKLRYPQVRFTFSLGVEDRVSH